MQVDLLRVLETKELMRVGSDRPAEGRLSRHCATNDNLPRAVEAGQFREDFYYRINVFTIELPPLRTRRPTFPLWRNISGPILAADGEADHGR